MFGAIAGRVLIKEESPSYTLVQAAEHQATSQPEVKIEQVEEESSSHSAMEEVEDQSTLQPEVQTEQQFSRHDYRSRIEAQTSSSESGEEELPIDDGSSSHAWSHEAVAQSASQPQVQSGPQHSRQNLPTLTVHQTSLRDEPDVEVEFTGKKAVSKHYRMKKYGSRFVNGTFPTDGPMTHLRRFF